MCHFFKNNKKEEPKKEPETLTIESFTSKITVISFERYENDMKILNKRIKKLELKLK